MIFLSTNWYLITSLSHISQTPTQDQTQKNGGQVLSGCCSTFTIADNVKQPTGWRIFIKFIISLRLPQCYRCIQAPAGPVEADYVNRKSFHSLNVQVRIGDNCPQALNWISNLENTTSTLLSNAEQCYINALWDQAPHHWLLSSMHTYDLWWS